MRKGESEIEKGIEQERWGEGKKGRERASTREIVGERESKRKDKPSDERVREDEGEKGRLKRERKRVRVTK